MGVVAEQAAGETLFEIVVVGVVAGPWGYLDQDNHVVEAAFQEDSLGLYIVGSPEEETCVAEEDGIRLVPQMVAEGIDSCRTLAAEADIDALESTLEIVEPVGDEQSSTSQRQLRDSLFWQEILESEGRQRRYQQDSSDRRISEVVHHITRKMQKQQGV